MKTQRGNADFHFSFLGGMYVCIGVYSCVSSIMHTLYTCIEFITYIYVVPVLVIKYGNCITVLHTRYIMPTYIGPNT